MLLPISRIVYKFPSYRISALIASLSLLIIIYLVFQMKDSKAKVERFCPYRKRPKIVLNSGDVCESTLETEKVFSDI